jgi:TonB family protein
MSLDIFRSKPALLRHGLSLLISLVIHAGLIYFLVVHFVSVRIIDFREQVTSVLLVPPEKLQLPKIEGNLPNPQDWGAQFPELASRGARPQRKAAAAGAAEPPPETFLGPPVDSKLTSRFSLAGTPQEKEGTSLDKRPRFTFPMGPKSGSAGAPIGTAPAQSRDLRQYIHGSPGGSGRGSSVGAYYGGRGGAASGYSRAAAPPLVKNFDLSPWARTVIDLIQKNWSIPPAQMVRTEDTVEIAVVILKNGQIFSAAIVRHSDNRTFDQAALEAVEESAPLPPLPGDFPAASVEISFVFAQQW